MNKEDYSKAANLVHDVVSFFWKIHVLLSLLNYNNINHFIVNVIM